MKKRFVAMLLVFAMVISPTIAFADEVGKIFIETIESKSINFGESDTPEENESILKIEGDKVIKKGKDQEFKVLIDTDRLSKLNKKTCY